MRPDDTPRKRCTKCGELLPATAEFFYARTDRPSGFKSECRACSCAMAREYQSTHREQRLAYLREYNITHRDQKQAYRDAHKAQQQATRAAYHADHREQRNAYCRQYHETHREERREYAATYNAAHKEMGAVRSRNRRAREGACGGTHTDADVLAQLDRQRGRCYWCGAKVTAYDVDHVIPLSKGGSNGPENLVIACPSCNRRKHAKMPHEFSDRLC